MAEEKKYIVVAPDVYEMLLIKAETPVNPIASTIKQTQENFYAVWNRVGISEGEEVWLHTGELNTCKQSKKVKDKRNAIAHPV